MSSFSHSLRSLLLIFGLDLKRTAYSLWGLPKYIADFREFKRQQVASSEKFRFGRPCPCLADLSMESGSASGHYFHQDLLVARRVFHNQPATHVDVGSRIDGFVAHVASFRPVRVLDIRPLSHRIPNIEFLQADLMQPPASELAEFCDSLSCLHTLEHFGLGRYGDPINYLGHLIGLDNLGRMLRIGGRLYISTPIGAQRIEFNAHRVFAVDYLLGLFSENYRLEHFSFVDDAGELHEHVPLKEADIARNFGCTYGCGIFELIKR